MNEDVELEELIKEIALKHGIALGRDDPILILQSLNNRLLQASQKVQQAMLDQYKAELEDLSLRWSVDAKENAYSGSKLPPIPDEYCHPFHFKAATDSG